MAERSTTKRTRSRATTGRRSVASTPRRRTAAGGAKRATKGGAKGRAKGTAKRATKGSAKRAAKRTAAKRSAKRPAKRAAKSTQRSSGAAPAYTKPALRERLKAKIRAGTRGGRAGQWSARKAQLLAQEYEKAGGGYRGAKRSTQRHLDAWGEEGWTTRDGKKAARGGTTARYLPKAAWRKLSPAERKATDDRKRKGTRAGKARVPNTAKARRARSRSER